MSSKRFPKILAAKLLTSAVLVSVAFHAQADFNANNPLRDFYSSSLTQDFRSTFSASATVNVDIPYGVDDRQKYDVYLPGSPSSAPIIVMVHGGGWVNGDKQDVGVAAAKAAYWMSRGFIFVSVNYRLAPEADPMSQAADIASAIAHIQANAGKWGGDTVRIVLMGHGAGGHLVALLSANPGYVSDKIAQPLAGAVVLDTIALDVPALMNSSNAANYAQAFGADPTFWQDTSPEHTLSQSGLPMLVVCSQANPADSCGQAQAFKTLADQNNVNAQVLPTNLSPSAVSSSLGSLDTYTSQVNSFIQSIL